MKKENVANGIYWVEIPEADLRILCGCPADSVKHLTKRGFIAPAVKAGVAYETGPNAILLIIVEAVLPAQLYESVPFALRLKLEREMVVDSVPASGLSSAVLRSGGQSLPDGHGIGIA